MTLYLFGFLLYINKLDAKRVRKRNLIILIVTIIFTFSTVGAVFYVGMQPNHLTLSENELHITGAYGVDWPIEAIMAVQLVEELPKIQMRTNGFAYSERLKGRFRLENLGNGKLYLYRNNPPFLFIEKVGDYVFINAKNREKTVQWFDDLKGVVE